MSHQTFKDYSQPDIFNRSKSQLSVKHTYLFSFYINLPLKNIYLYNIFYSDGQFHFTSSMRRLRACVFKLFGYKRKICSVFCIVMSGAVMQLSVDLVIGCLLVYKMNIASLVVIIIEKLNPINFLSEYYLIRNLYPYSQNTFNKFIKIT